MAVLHRGRMLAEGEVPEVIAATGKTDMRGAFARLSGVEATEEGGA